MKQKRALPSLTYLQLESRNVPVDQRVLILRLYHECGLNAAEAARKYSQINPGMRPVTGRYVLKLAEKFDKTGTVCNSRKTGRPRLTTDDFSAFTIIREASRMNDISISKVARRCNTTKYAVQKILKERNFRLNSTPTTGYKSDPVACCLAQSISTQTITTSNNPKGNIQVPSRAIECGLPLLPPSAAMLISPQTDTSAIPRICVSPIPSPLPDPQILHTCSGATHAAADVCEARSIDSGAPDRASPISGLDGAQNFPLSHNTSTTVQTSRANISAATGVYRIDLSVSIDEDPEATTKDIGANKVQSPSMIHAADEKLRSNRCSLRSGIAKTESHLRNLVCEKKLEVSELKERYWTEKLRLLFRKTRSPLKVECNH